MKKTPPKPQNDQVLVALLSLAAQDGRSDDPDREVGDLQGLLRALWPMLTSEQKQAFMKTDAVSALVETQFGARPIRYLCDIEKFELQAVGAELEVDLSALKDEEKIALVNEVRIVAAAAGAGSMPSNAEARYLVGNWMHLFGPGEGRETLTRIVFDKEANEVVAMQVHRRGDLGFSNSTRAECLDVTDSIVNANPEALDAPDEWGLDPANDVPQWAAGLMAASPAPRQRGG